MRDKNYITLNYNKKEDERNYTSFNIKSDK